MDPIVIPWTGNAGPNPPSGMVLPWIFEGAGAGGSSGLAVSTAVLVAAEVI